MLDQTTSLVAIRMISHDLGSVLVVVAVPSSGTEPWGQGCRTARLGAGWLMWEFPPPRSPPDGRSDDGAPAGGRGGDERSGNGLVEPDFRYCQHRMRWRFRCYNGFIEPVGGAEGEWLRKDLAAVIRDLLDWAIHTAHDDIGGSRCGRHADSADSDEDGGTR